MVTMDTVEIDVEGLFNDGQLDQILPTEHTLQAATLAVPGLAEHFLRLQFSGGYNRVSWSRQGHIAVISEDGSTVSIHCLRSGLKNREWKLSDSRPLAATFEYAVHVAWSPSGFDLAIIDSRGRIGIYSMTTVCLNRLNEAKSALAEMPDDVGMPIATWWLNQDRSDRPRSVLANATKSEDRWTHNMAKAKALGPLYPRAFCLVSRQGIFSLVYQRPGARYTRTSVVLPCLQETTYSHAALAPTAEGKILLAVYSTSEILSVYHVQITWPQDLMTDPTSTTQPELGIDTVDSCVSMWTEIDGSNNSLTQGYKPNKWTLTHLVIVPTTDVVENAVHEPPSIWAVYTLINSTPRPDTDGFPVNSVIRRWSVSPSIQNLHPRFNEMPAKTEQNGIEENVFVVERLSDLVFPQTVTSVELVEQSQLVAISTADSRTEVWNPITQALVSFEGTTTEITSLAQFGFAFHPAMNVVTTALSPNACADLTLSIDSKPSIHYVQYPIQTAAQDLDLSDPHQSASVAAVILTFARSCWSNTNGDDVLACVLANYTPRQCITVVSEMYRTLFRDTEFIHEKAPGSDVDHLLSKPFVVKLLSFQMGLFSSNGMSINSTDENIRQASLSSVWAWLTINLRYVATSFYIYYRGFQATFQAGQNPGQPSPTLSASFTDAMCNTVRWVLDLFRFILTTILEIGDRQTNPDLFTLPTFTNNLGDATGDGSQGLVALILNCQWSRTFLFAIFRAMKAFIEANDRGHNPHIAKIVYSIRRYSVGKGMNTSAIDKILDPRWYVRNGLRDGEQMDQRTIAKRQIAMCSSGRVGPEYAGTLKMLLEKAIDDPENGLRATNEIERLKLFTETTDLNWLLLGFNPQVYEDVDTNSVSVYALDGDRQLQKERKLYDVHRKSQVVLTSTPNRLVRRCVRCGSISGDVEGQDKIWSKHMVGYLARCVCDAYWILEPVSGEEG